MHIPLNLQMMKNTVFVFMLLGLLSCKKKEEEKPPAPTPPVVTPGRANVFTAKLNGTAWAVSGNQTASAKIDMGVATGTPKQYVFTGMTSSSLYKNSIQVWATYSIGTIDLRAHGAGAIYFDATGYAFYIDSGSMTISAIDTSHVKSAACDKFKATFNFVTDSVGGVGYVIEDGSIDFEAP